MRDEEAAVIAEALGHLPKGAESDLRGERWRFECSCGYKSTYRMRVKGAIEAGIHHMRKVAQEGARNGVNIPREMPPRRATVG
jgi:hypothetical protein